MFREILSQAWASLCRRRTRTILTMLGIVWGIVAVTLLLAYGSGFRAVLMHTFHAFGNNANVAWPGTTSEQAGGERAGQQVVFEQQDVDRIRANGTYIKTVCPETVKFLGISYGNNWADTAIRGVCPEYGYLRNETLSIGRWISPEDDLQHRRVVFIGHDLREKLFGKHPAVGEYVRISGVRFLVIGTMEKKFADSNYFTSDDQSAWIPYSAAGDLWNTRQASVLVFAPIAPKFDQEARAQLVSIIAERQHFSGKDKRAITIFGMEEVRPIYQGITIGCELLLLFVGVLTLGIGGVGVMNIMLVSVNERTREIGLRRALGARKRHIRLQFLCESLAITLAGGVIGIILSIAIGAAIGTLPFLGPAYQDTSGVVDIHMQVSPWIMGVSTIVLLIVGLVSGLMPAMRAAGLDPVEALHEE
jgi:putative ABC transport system permease protein